MTQDTPSVPLNENQVKRRSGLPSNLTGMIFGRLTVGNYSHHSSSGHDQWVCKCSCGNSTTVGSYALFDGRTVSCGCYGMEQRMKAIVKHRQSKTKVYFRWKSMHKRCSNPNDRQFMDYGGRGIRVCDRWREFENFLSDMGQPPLGGMLERIDNNSDYSPENCKWATRTEQNNNTRKNRFIEHGGVRLTISQWARRLGITPALLSARIGRLGWTMERAMTGYEQTKPSPK
jgi:hypothetical protein